ncbi:MAG: sigma-54 dependent transcriptional regulator [Candidatus Binatia bacterium]
MKDSARRDPVAGKARILVVEDDREMSRFLTQLLSEEGYEVEVVNDGPSALEAYQGGSFDLIISDLMMPRMKGTELVRRLKATHPDALVLLITAFGTIESAVEAIHAGAFHYLTKPFRTDELLIHVQRSLEQHQLKQELVKLREEMRNRYQFQNIVGRSENMKKIFDTVAHISDLPANVLILGESGTGKEMIARAIHRHSARAEGPFVPLNCAAIPETLLESELFGYLRGAFTDARKDRLGLFQEASGGILFLDEISEIPLNLQAKLLRVIEDKEVRPLGANQSERVDTRVVSACNRDLEHLVEEGRFRQDLYYRLNVIRVELPSLRERPEDIPLLSEHFLRKFAPQTKRKLDGIDQDAMAALMSYRWPGNVRELEHTIERAVLLGKESTIGLNDLPPQLATAGENTLPLVAAVGRAYTLRDLEREYILRVIENTHGNKTEAAKILGVDRTTLYRKLDEYKVKA